MGIIARQGSKSAIILFFGMALGYVINLIIYPFCLSPDEIGLVRVLISAGTMFATFLPLGSNNAIIKFYPQYKNANNGHNGLLFTVLVIGLLGGALGVGALFFSQTWLYKIYGSQISEFNHFALHVAILMVIISITNIIQDFCKTLLRIALPFFFKQIIQRILIASATLVYFSGMVDLNEFIFLIDGAYGAILLLHVGYIFKLKVKSIKIGFPFKDAIERKAFFGYSSFVILSGLSMILLENIDNLMLGAISGLDSSGIYSISFFIATLVDVPRRAVMRISTPVVSQAFRNNDKSQIQSIYQKSSINAFFAGAVLFLMIWVNIDSIFSLMPKGEIYVVGKNVVVILGLARLFDIIFGINGQIINMSNYFKYNALFAVVLVLLAFFTNLWLIPIYGIAGAAYGTSISYVLFNILKHLFILKKFKFTPFTSNLYKLIGVFAVTFIIQFFAPHIENFFLNVLVRSSIVIVSFAVLFSLLKIKVDLIDQIIHKFLKTQA